MFPRNKQRDERGKERNGEVKRAGGKGNQRTGQLRRSAVAAPAHQWEGLFLIR